MSLRGLSTVSFWADEVTAAAAWYAQFLGVEAYFTRPGPDGRLAYAEFRIGDHQAALATDARAKAAFERLGKSGRYAVILPLLKARTAQTRARILARAVARLAAQNSTHMTAARATSPRAARRCSPDRGYGTRTGVGRIALLH